MDKEKKKSIGVYIGLVICFILFSIFGAGITETTIGFWGYIALSVIMIVSVFKAIKEFQKGRTKKVIGSILQIKL